MNTKDPLVNELISIQELNHYSDSKMAELIGCSRQLYQATRTGKISVGLRIIKGSLNAFPQLRNIAVILAGLVDTTPLPEKSQNRFLDLVEDLGEWIYALCLKIKEVIGR